MKRKRIIYACLLTLVSSLSYAQVNDHLLVNKTEMVSEKQSGFDKISWKGEYTTQEISKPQLPVYQVSYVLPIDVLVTGVTFTTQAKQKHEQNFNIIPVQQPVLTDNSTKI